VGGDKSSPDTQYDLLTINLIGKLINYERSELDYEEKTL